MLVLNDWGIVGHTILRQQKAIAQLTNNSNLAWSQWHSISLLFQGSNMRYIGVFTSRIHSACYTHRNMQQQQTNMQMIEEKKLQFERFLFYHWWNCALAIEGLLACLHCTHKQIRFLCKEALFPTTWQIQQYNRQAHLALKGNGRWHTSWFFARYA